MPLFQFSALDQAGQEKRGTIEAGTQQEAFAAIQRYGLHPTNVFAINQVPLGYPGMSGMAAPAPPARSCGGAAAILLSMLAILLALGSLGWQFYRFYVPAKPKTERLDLPGKGLQGYDFSTPQNAIRSLRKMKLDDDLKAQYEVNQLRPDPELEEELQTLEVRKEVVWKGMTLLFLSYDRDGMPRYLVRAVEKDPKTNRWLPRRLNRKELQSDNPTLAAQVKAWETEGKLPQ